MSFIALTHFALSQPLRLLWLQGSSFHGVYPSFSSQVSSLAPAQENVTARLQVLPRGDFFSLIKIHYHEDGRFCH
jgi:hypothetical protein